MLLVYLSLLETEQEKTKFERLYDAHRKSMLFFALDILQDVATAEDAVHDSFLKILPLLERIPDADDPKSRTYLLMVVRTVALDAYRARRRVQPISQEVEQIPVTEALALDAVSLHELRAGIEQMPDVDRDVLLYRYYYGHSDAEIAHILNIKRTSVAKYAQRAKRRLQAYLAAQERG